MFCQLSLCLVWEAEEMGGTKRVLKYPKGIKKPTMDCSPSLSFGKEQMGKVKVLKWDVKKNFLTQ